MKKLMVYYFFIENNSSPVKITKTFGFLKTLIFLKPIVWASETDLTDIKVFSLRHN